MRGLERGGGGHVPSARNSGNYKALANLCFVFLFSFCLSSKAISFMIGFYTFYGSGEKRTSLNVDENTLFVLFIV